MVNMLKMMVLLLIFSLNHAVFAEDVTDYVQEEVTEAVEQADTEELTEEEAMERKRELMRKRFEELRSKRGLPVREGYPMTPHTSPEGMR